MEPASPGNPGESGGRVELTHQLKQRVTDRTRHPFATHLGGNQLPPEGSVILAAARWPRLVPSAPPQHVSPWGALRRQARSPGWAAPWQVPG